MSALAVRVTDETISLCRVGKMQQLSCEKWEDSTKSIDNKSWTTDRWMSLPSRNTRQDTWKVQVDELSVPHERFLAKHCLSVIITQKSPHTCLALWSCLNIGIFQYLIIFCWKVYSSSLSYLQLGVSLWSLLRNYHCSPSLVWRKNVHLLSFFLSPEWWKLGTDFKGILNPQRKWQAYMNVVLPVNWSREDSIKEKAEKVLWGQEDC